MFSAKHPVFTACGTQNGICDDEGNRLYWPVARYFYEGAHEAVFLGEAVTKHHRTLTTDANALLRAGFSITGLVEPLPPKKLLKDFPDMQDEMRRPMRLLVVADKNYSV